MSLYVNLINKYPTAKMYVTWGWLIVKNNLINASYSMLINEYKEEDDKFWIEDWFFSHDILHAININHEKNVKSVITVDCISKKINESQYLIEMWLYKSKEKSPFFAYKKKKKNIDDLVHELNFLFFFVSNFINDSTFDFDQDLEKILIATRKNYAKG